jgi:hypothetical protein
LNTRLKNEINDNKWNLRLTDVTTHLKKQTVNNGIRKYHTEFFIQKTKVD